MQLIDSHTHIHFDKFAGRVEEVLSDAAKAGVKRTINVGVSLEDSRQALALASSHKSAWASIGLHPHEAKDLDDQTLQELMILADRPKVVAIGEIGLDYYKLFSTKAEQKKAFRHQIEAGLKTGLPFIFHVRDAWQDFLAIIDDYQNIRGVVHSFSSHISQLDEILARGLYIGLNGIMTFSDDRDQLAAAKQVPANRLLLETDAPFLAPAGRRGKTCEPQDLLITAKFLAKLRGEELAELADQTTNNAEALFNLK